MKKFISFLIFFPCFIPLSTYSKEGDLSWDSLHHFGHYEDQYVFISFYDNAVYGYEAGYTIHQIEVNPQYQHLRLDTLEIPSVIEASDGSRIEFNGITRAAPATLAEEWCLKLPSTICYFRVNDFPQYASNVIQYVAVSSENPYFTAIDGLLYTKDKRDLIYCPEGRRGSVRIPDGVERIANYAFLHCTNLEHVECPSSLQEIGKGAFQECRSFESFVIPDNTLYVGDDAFVECKALKSIEIGRNVNAFQAANVFTGTSLDIITVHPDNTHFRSSDNVLFLQDTLVYFPRSKSGEYVIPEGTAQLGRSAMEGCLLQKLVMPSTLRYVGPNACSSCEQLEEVGFSMRLDSIGARAFNECVKLHSAYIPSCLSVGKNSFERSGVSSVTLNESTFLYGYAFAECPNLKTVSVLSEDGDLRPGLPSKLQKIMYGIFYKCRNLDWGERLLIPSSVTEIGPVAFYGNHAQSVLLPEGLTSFDETSVGAMEIRELRLPKSLCEIELVAPLSLHLTLESIYVDPDNERYKDVEGVLCTMNGELIWWPGGRSGNCRIPEGVTSVNYLAFYCNGFNGESLTELPYKGITSLQIPEGVTTLVPTETLDEPYLTLNTMILPSTIKEIGNGLGNWEVCHLICLATIPPRLDEAPKLMNGAVLFVPGGCKEVYTSSIWGTYYTDIRELGSNWETGVYGIQDSEDWRIPQTIYTLDGLRHKSLLPGVNLVNGRKLVIK